MSHEGSPRRSKVFEAAALIPVLGFADCMASLTNAGSSPGLPVFAVLTLGVLALAARDLVAQTRAEHPEPTRVGAVLLGFVPAWILGSVAALEMWLRGWACYDGICMGPSYYGGAALVAGCVATAFVSWVVVRLLRQAPVGLPRVSSLAATATVARIGGVIALAGSAAVLVVSSVAALRAPSPDGWYPSLPVAYRWGAEEFGPTPPRPLGFGYTVTRTAAGATTASLVLRDREGHGRGEIYGTRDARATREVRYDAALSRWVVRGGEEGVVILEDDTYLTPLSHSGTGPALRAHLRAGTLSAPRGWLLLGLEGPLFALLVYLFARRRVATLRAASWVRVDPESAPVLDPRVARELPRDRPCWVVLDPPVAEPMRGSQRIERVVLTDPHALANALETDAWFAIFGASLLTSAPLSVVLYLARFG